MSRFDLRRSCEKAFTGLEAAIVLIAFVVVAAVFSYVILGAGFFTSQTAQATVQSGVKVASSSMLLDGNVYGIQVDNNPYLSYVNVSVALTAGGTPLDLSQIIVSYSDNNGGYNSSLAYMGVAPDGGSPCASIVGGTAGGDASWCISEKFNNETAGARLDNNAQMILSVGVPATATANTKFTINFQPVGGAVLPVKRTVPATISPVQILY